MSGKDEQTQNAIDLGALNCWLLAFVTLVGQVSQLLAVPAWIQLTGASFVVTPATTLLMAGSSRLSRSLCSWWRRTGTQAELTEDAASCRVARPLQGPVAKAAVPLIACVMPRVARGGFACIKLEVFKQLLSCQGTLVDHDDGRAKHWLHTVCRMCIIPPQVTCHALELCQECVQAPSPVILL